MMTIAMIIISFMVVMFFVVGLGQQLAIFCGCLAVGLILDVIILMILNKK